MSFCLWGLCNYLVSQLAKDLIPEFFIVDALVNNIVGKNLFFSPAQVGVISEAEDQLEEGHRVVVIRRLGLCQERGLDGFPLHLPEVGLEVDVGKLKKGNRDQGNLWVWLWGPSSWVTFEKT